MLQVVNAKKSFKTVKALKGLSFEVKEGEFFGLLGPNGAGKTTLIHSIVGLNRLSSGEIYVGGYDVRKDFLKTHSLIGFAPQEMNLDRFFSIRKILLYQAGFYGIPKKDRASRVDELLEQFDLTEKTDLPYYRLSGGMQKRLQIAKALLGKPQLLILDEPTAGVDVEQRHSLWTYLRQLNNLGTTIILTSHYIDEVEELCERVGIIDLGELKELGTTKELIQKYAKPHLTLNLSKNLDDSLFHNLNFEVHVKDSQIRGTGEKLGKMSQDLYQIIQKSDDCHIIDMKVEGGDLEEVFLKVTGNKKEEAA